MKFSMRMSHHGELRSLNLTQEEQELVETAIGALVSGSIDKDPVTVIRKSDSYCTIVARGETFNFDLIHFKMTPRTKWASVWVIGEDRDTYRDSSLFAMQANKKPFYWKAGLSMPEDVLVLVPLALKAFWKMVGKCPNDFKSRRE